MGSWTVDSDIGGSRHRALGSGLTHKEILPWPWPEFDSMYRVGFGFGVL